MKILFSKLFFLIAVLVAVISCTKNDTLVKVEAGSSTTLSASTTTIVLDTTNAATANALTLNWGVVSFGEGELVPKATYTLQIDSGGHNFNAPQNISLGSVATISFTKASLNTIALDSPHISATVMGKMEMRIKADINQSSGSASTIPSIYSNAVSITVTPYSTKPTPKFPVPDNLFIVGDATPGGWNNPVPAPSQQLTKIDDNTFGIILQLTGGKQFLLLPKNGDWGNKYASSAASPNPTGDTFGPNPDPNGAANPPNNNFNGPTTSGLYQIIVDFVKGTYTITPVTTNPIPAGLFIVGDATPGGWANPVPVPSQQFTQVSNGAFQLTVSLAVSGSYLLLPVNGDWSHKYGGATATGGALLKDGDVPSSNTPAPAVAGNYLINVNFFSNTYKVTKQ